MKKAALIILVISISSGVFASWNNASDVMSGFVSAMNKADKNEALKYCAYQMKEYILSISSYFIQAKKNPSKYKAHYYIFKKEQNAGSYSFYVFTHIPYQKAVRYALFNIDNVNGSYKITKMVRISPFRVVNP